MTEQTKKATNTVAEQEVGGDKVAMLSLNKDGTPDQHNPEIIGDKEFATAAAKRQFAEQAVSAADDAEKSAATLGETVEQDPTIAARQKEHEAITEAAEKRAEKVVGDLHQA